MSGDDEITFVPGTDEYPAVEIIPYEPHLPIEVSQLLDGDQEAAAVMSRIPLLAGDSKKMTYLGYRSTGFGVNEAVILAGISRSTVQHWRRVDPAFKEIETNRLIELQAKIGPEVVRLEFMRNYRMIMQKDYQVIGEVMSMGLDGVSDKVLDYYNNIRKHYTPHEMLNLQKALYGDNSKQDIAVTIKLGWGADGGPALELSQAPAIDAIEGPDGKYYTE